MKAVPYYCPIFVSELYTSNKSITELAESLKLNRFVSLLNLTDLSSDLDSSTRYTVFAPNDQAFASLSPEALEELANDKELLRDTLMMHISKGKIVTEAMNDKDKITSLGGTEELWVNVIDNRRVCQRIFQLFYQFRKKSKKEAPSKIVAI